MVESKHKISFHDREAQLKIWSRVLEDDKELERFNQEWVPGFAIARAGLYRAVREDCEIYPFGLGCYINGARRHTRASREASYFRSECIDPRRPVFMPGCKKAYGFTPQNIIYRYLRSIKYTCFDEVEDETFVASLHARMHSTAPCTKYGVVEDTSNWGKHDERFWWKGGLIFTEERIVAKLKYLYKKDLASTERLLEILFGNSLKMILPNYSWEKEQPYLMPDPKCRVGLQEKICVVCHKTFKIFSSQAGRKTCSSKCWDAHFLETKKVYYDACKRAELLEKLRFDEAICKRDRVMATVRAACELGLAEWPSTKGSERARQLKVIYNAAREIFNDDA